MKRATAVLVLLLCLLVPACATLKKNAGIGGSAAAGGAAGAALGGPLGAALGAGVAAVVFSSMSGEDEFRSGEVVSKKAQEDQDDRLVRILQGKLKSAEGEIRDVQSKVDYMSRIRNWSIGLGLLYLAFRNRAHLLAFGPGYLSRLWHAIVGSPKQRKSDAKAV